MLMTALCVPASAADDFKSAKFVNSGSKVSFSFKVNEKNKDGSVKSADPKMFKVELSKKGTLKLDVVSGASWFYIQVIDEDGAELFEYNDKEAISGTVGNYSDGASIYWKESIKKAKCTLKYTLNKGTYFVKLFLVKNAEIDGKTSVTFTYPQDKSESSDSAKITSFTVTLKKGSTLQLGTILSGDGTVTWSTSKKAVATVSSKGKVTAKSKGTAVITAKTGDSSMKITIKVT